MGLKFNTENNVIWLKINDDLDVDQVDEKYNPVEGEAVFQINMIDPKTGIKLIEDATKAVWDKGQRFEKTDFYKLQIKKICKMIIGWKGVLDPSGSPIECTDQWKETVFRYNRAFFDAINDKVDEIAKIKSKDKEEEEKN